jgi:hypothetical protein
MADPDAGRLSRPAATQEGPRAAASPGWLAVVPFKIMRLRPLLPDAGLAVMVSLPALVGTIPALGSERRPVLAAAVPLALLQTLPLAWRRVQPLAVLAVTVAATVALFLAGDRYFPLGVAIALYTVAAHRERPQALRAGLAALAVLAVPILLTSYPRPDALIANVVVLALCWTLGAYLGELRARAARAEWERQVEARRAVAEEQARIARELHDVIAHNVSVMVVQAAAGADVFDTSPERARQALARSRPPAAKPWPSYATCSTPSPWTARRWRRSRGWPGWTRSPARSAPPVLRSSCAWRARRCRCLPAPTCPPTGSCRRR